MFGERGPPLLSSPGRRPPFALCTFRFLRNTAALHIRRALTSLAGSPVMPFLRSRLADILLAEPINVRPFAKRGLLLVGQPLRGAADHADPPDAWPDRDAGHRLGPADRRTADGRQRRQAAGRHIVRDLERVAVVGLGAGVAERRDGDRNEHAEELLTR